MKKWRRWGWALLWACLTLVRAAPFQDGETVCFLGDSITHGGLYHSLIYDYYLTRFPERTIRFVNAGISGDTAGGALERLQEDVLAHHPTTVVILLGMNDVGRGNYVESPDEGKRKAAQDAIERYRTRMDQILETLRAAGPMKIVLLTPSPYDQTVVNDRNNNQPGCNDGLGLCAEIVRSLAGKHDAEV
ncbi:MAG: SGNH/GDSL hydrolase family protein, partial [Kiritimatiellia bacterium]|nr:SGNH/GDSL hydrolase family protein [Kiritimatiellia bacterium]